MEKFQKTRELFCLAIFVLSKTKIQTSCHNIWTFIMIMHAYIIIHTHVSFVLCNHYSCLLFVSIWNNFFAFEQVTSSNRVSLQIDLNAFIFFL